MYLQKVLVVCCVSCVFIGLCAVREREAWRTDILLAGKVGGMRKDVTGRRGRERKTNYQRDNRRAMDFLPGLLCYASILFLSIFVSLSPDLNSGEIYR